MSNSRKVRASRDGDQFHYLWAARRCLPLLNHKSGLVAVSIEGPSSLEASDGVAIEAGEEKIDVGEYYGDERLCCATRVIYTQLKHSTLQSSTAWTASGLKDTLSGFAQRFKKQREQYGIENTSDRLRFRFVTNRPIQEDAINAVRDLASGGLIKQSPTVDAIREATSLGDDLLSEFCRLLKLDGDEPNLWEQKHILRAEVAACLPGDDGQGLVPLKELVARKATSEFATNPSIRKMDVLRVFHADETTLFPAPCAIISTHDVVPRAQDADLLRAIVKTNGRPVVIHADGGVGKSVFASRIEEQLPPGSTSVLYDCFGNGTYRNRSQCRHRPKDALVQIANELAGRSLCNLLIPSPLADVKAYVRAFLSRLQEVIDHLRAVESAAVLCIIIDAADNAEIAAHELGDGPSFVRDLLRESMPDGVRVVALCRTHRLESLRLPSNASIHQLLPFALCETAPNLRRIHPDATDAQVEEFHLLTSQNPRVQALALARSKPLDTMLSELGPQPTTVDDTISSMLQTAIDLAVAAQGDVDQAQLSRVCTGLASLPPLVPVAVLASLSGVSDAAVRTFVTDIGRPVAVIAESIRFFDEPTESWFRQKFAPEKKALSEFVDALRPLASKYVYVATVLPQLMFEADRLDDVVRLALSNEAVPQATAAEQQEVKLRRLEFAAKACLKEKRFIDAAKLFLKGAGLSAGRSRQTELLRRNTDLVGRLADGSFIESLASERRLSSGWLGSHNAYNAGMMSSRSELRGQALSHLRAATDWLRNWTPSPEDHPVAGQVTAEDVAEIAIAELNLHGARRSARFLRMMRSRFQPAQILARRLVDSCRYSDLDEVAKVAGSDLCVVLAITHEFRQVNRAPSSDVIDRGVRLLRDRRVRALITGDVNLVNCLVGPVMSLVAAASLSGRFAQKDLDEVITALLPPSPSSSVCLLEGDTRSSVLRTRAIHAVFCGKELEAADLAPEDMQRRENPRQLRDDTDQARRFRSTIGVLLPWYQLQARVLAGSVRASDLQRAISSALAESQSASAGTYRERGRVFDEIALVWFGCLIDCNCIDEESVQPLEHWIGEFGRPLYVDTATTLARMAGPRASLRNLSIKYLAHAYKLTRVDLSDADTQIDAYIKLARAGLAISDAEARGYFDEAIKVSTKAGDEHSARWDALLTLAQRGALSSPNPELAYRLARTAEFTRRFTGRDKHVQWNTTVQAIVGLCPSSSLAILSRWRDRGVAACEGGLAVAVTALLDGGFLDPRTALALMVLCPELDRFRVLREALNSASNFTEKAAMAKFFFRYGMADSRAAKAWQDLKDLMDACSISCVDVEEHLMSCKSAEGHQSPIPVAELAPSRGCQRRGQEFDAGTVFSNCDLSSVEGISRAFRQLRCTPQHLNKFFPSVFRYVAIGSEPKFVAALRDVDDFDVCHLERFLTEMPSEWVDRPAIRNEVVQTIESCFRRQGVGIAVWRTTGRRLLEISSSRWGLKSEDLIDTALSAIGSLDYSIDALDCFKIVELLTLRLSGDEARDALDCGLKCLEPEMDDDIADGPWSSALAPPTLIDDAVAGYMWATLASPAAATRWGGAHAVRGLCALERVDVLNSLINLASSQAGGTFADVRLHFYHLHALQWLMIALARAAKENPSVLVPHFEWFRQMGGSGDHHVLIRGFAAQAKLALMASGRVSSDLELPAQPQNINRSSFPAEWTDGGAQHHGGEDACAKSGKKFFFGIDAEPEWFRPLGRCFGLEASYVEQLVKTILSHDRRFDCEDPCMDVRANLGLYQGNSTFSRRDDPEVHNLPFYLMYHGVCVAAGWLLATKVVVADPDEPVDRFEAWLSRIGLSCPDGTWLADRLDPPPPESLQARGDWVRRNWRWSLTRGDFDRALWLEGGRANLWGRWTEIDDWCEEHVWITSALVSRDRSDALLRATQTAQVYDYLLPRAGADNDLTRGPFQLVGWISVKSPHEGLDRDDPWAMSIDHSIVLPADFVVSKMHLCEVRDRRQWVVDSTSDQRPVIWSRVWAGATTSTKEWGNGGSRVEVSLDFLSELLAAFSMDLIVEVQMDRRLRAERFRQEQIGDYEYLPPSARLFLFDSAGRMRTL